jgi:predicted RNA-binding Zn ribbon-like protein
MIFHDGDAQPSHGSHSADGGRHGHLAAVEDGLDFVNTLEYTRGAPVDHLSSGQDALRWFEDHDLLHREMRAGVLERWAEAPVTETRTLARIRRVREALRELLDATVERRPPEHGALDEVNRALRTHYVYELVPAPDGIALDHRHEGDPIDGALARLAESIARELSQGDPERLRVCANDDCRWVFKDTSRTSQRKWCDMSTCGNRAKVARHRERKRTHEQGSGPVVAPAPGVESGDVPAA